MGWKLSAIPAVTSTMLFVMTVALMQTFGFGVEVVAALFIMLAVQWLLLAPVAQTLNRVHGAMFFLAQNKPAAEIAVSDINLLKPLVDSVNTLIRERGDLKTMQGKLVEQISAAAAQEERNRLARDLHDSIKQQVFSMSVSAAAAHAHLETNPAAAKQAMLDVKQCAQEAMVEMRALLQQLSPAPLEKVGLVQALRDQCEALAYRTGAQVETHFGALPPDEQIPTGAQETLFRIAQEALSNIARHARASRVDIRLACDEEALTLSIADNGQGFDPQTTTSGMGLRNIQTRADSINAQLTVTSQPGTSLKIVIPLTRTIEVDMQTELSAQVKSAVNQYFRFAAATSIFFLTVSILGWRLLNRPVTGELFLNALLLVFFAGAVGSVPYAVLSYVRASRFATEVYTSEGHEGVSALYLRRHLHMAYMIIGFAGVWFLPILTLEMNGRLWLPVLVAAVMALFAVWNYWRMYTLYRQEMRLKSPTQRQTELTQRLAEMRSGWFTTGFLWFVLIVTGVLNGGFEFPPTEPDHWINVFFIVTAVFLLINQVLTPIVYRRWLTDGLGQSA